MEKKRKNDIILIAALLIIVLAAGAGVRFMSRKPGKAVNDSLTVEITENGTVLFKEKLSDLKLPWTYKVNTEEGTNEFLIEEQPDGTIGMQCTEADCPDKICVKTGIVTHEQQPIVCLPHKITAKFY